MAGLLNRGEIWLHHFDKPDKRRPVLVLTRPRAIPFLNTVTVATITSTIRGLSTEVRVGADEGLKHDSVVNLHNLATVEQSELRTFIGALSEHKMRQVCRALAIATGCN